ncbi:MAG: 4Fe-4S binding protein [Gemmatimonadota bacterium]
MTEPARSHDPGREPAIRPNPYRLLPALRGVVQAAYVAFFVMVGIEFHAFYAQIVSGGPVTARRPGAVEGFLPISALIGLKRFVLTGRWDEIHPAGLTILVAAIVSSLLARKVFCSWVCPVGGLSRFLEWAGRKTLWKRRKKATVVPRGADIALTSIKYLLLAFFIRVIVVGMDGAAIEAFRHNAYNYAADAKMLLFFTDISATAAATLAVLAVLSFAIKNFWCRYLCPYGALLGLVSWMSPQRVVRDGETCIDCKACTRACPAEIRVHAKASVWTPECTGCLSCVAACPVDRCLTVARKGKRSLSPYMIPAAGLATILAFWAVARLTGHWHTALPLSTLAEAYRQAHTLVHP